MTAARSAQDRLDEIRGTLAFVRSSNSKTVTVERYEDDVAFLLDLVAGAVS